MRRDRSPAEMRTAGALRRTSGGPQNHRSRAASHRYFRYRPAHGRRHPPRRFNRNLRRGIERPDRPDFRSPRASPPGAASAARGSMPRAHSIPLRRRKRAWIWTRVLWVNCGGNAEHALKSADLLIQAGGFGLVVLDLADTPDKDARRIPLASWFRLRHAAERTGAALVAVERQINARSCSAMQIEMRRKRTVWIGKLLRGFHSGGGEPEALPLAHGRNHGSEMISRTPDR